MLFRLLVSIILYLFVKEPVILATVAVAVMSYPFMVLVVATILRMRGDITEKSFINLVFKGFKITRLIRQDRNDLTNVKPNTTSKSKKQNL
jgi:hypothetical protein